MITIYLKQYNKIIRNQASEIFIFPNLRHF